MIEPPSNASSLSYTVGIPVATAVAVLFLGATCVLLRRRRVVRRSSSGHEHDQEMGGMGMSTPHGYARPPELNHNGIPYLLSFHRLCYVMLCHMLLFI
jgi:hypothetical protein